MTAMSAALKTRERGDELLRMLAICKKNANGGNLTPSDMQMLRNYIEAENRRPPSPRAVWSPDTPLSAIDVSGPAAWILSRGATKAWKDRTQRWCDISRAFWKATRDRADCLYQVSHSVQTCISILGPETTVGELRGDVHGERLWQSLQESDLAASTRLKRYHTFLSHLRLTDEQRAAWPKPARLPRGPNEASSTDRVRRHRQRRREAIATMAARVSTQALS